MLSEQNAENIQKRGVHVVTLNLGLLFASAFYITKKSTLKNFASFFKMVSGKEK